VPSITIIIERKDSYELATELVLALQESKAIINPVSAPQTNNFRTTLVFPDIQDDARERIMREASEWAITKGLKSSSTVDMQDSEASNLTIR
jgi:chemotaxis methyl-accepting protein methylase